MWTIADAASVMTLASCSRHGPWAADVYFARSEDGLYFYSSPQSRHCQDFAADSRTAATIHVASEHWRDIRGLQIVGKVVPVIERSAKAAAMAVYLAKFPLVRDFFQSPKSMGKAIADKMGRVAPYVLWAETIYVTDNTSGFGNRQEYHVAQLDSHS
ncbi:pyridoxamine 5'-phosphate oxidase family protein [Desulfovibrio inopinatus]|uniref:pyridoxamine 5'-phosphate oxidase family protein n=1 Tax=Desulfovibrio inopinatus TaxID=102109 RepID=UPI0004293339|nr:pyridoxamine 5'-phosphate oxidase family protein [Desulfovibrio inopinatus]